MSLGLSALIASFPITENHTIEHNGSTYRWKECLYDFAGNSRSPGCWADLWANENGEEIVTLGGDWEFYVEPHFKECPPDLEIPHLLNKEAAQSVKPLLEKDGTALHEFLRDLSCKLATV